MTFSNTFALIAATLLLAACSGGGLFSWLTQEEPVELLDEIDFVEIAEDRPLVQTVDTLVLERLPGGVIIRATGVPTTQGWYDAQLVREGGAAAGTGVAVYSFRARPPEGATRVSTQQSRELVAGAFLSDIELAGISSVRVLSASNSRTVGR